MFKEAITISLSEKSAAIFDEQIPKCFNFDFQPYLLLAFYQNITLLNRTIDNMDSQIVEIFHPIADKYFEKNKYLIKPLFANSFVHNLKISKKNWPHIELGMLLIQLKYNILFSKCSIVAALRQLIQSPAVLKEKYLPTMPQDHMYDIKIAMKSNPATQNTAFYACPNGHAYAIGDCGRPWVKSKCKECGVEIGGANHALEKGNFSIDQQILDNTYTGYGLQPASTMSDVPSNDRLLSQQTYHMQRFFTHACLYLACGDENEHLDEVMEAMYVNETVKPVIADLNQFFWEHMNKDLKILSKLLNLTIDELLILLHIIGFSFLLNPVSQSYQNANCGLDGKIERQTWEDVFAKVYLAPVLAAASEQIANANACIKKYSEKDESNKSRIYFMAYELMAEKESHFIYENEKFWKFRPLISFDFMAHELVNTTKQEHYKVLKKFHQMTDRLELTFYLPEIVKFVHMLGSFFGKKLFKFKAQSMPLSAFMAELSLDGWICERIEHVICCLQSVWVFAQYDLNNYSKILITVHFLKMS